MKERKNKNPNQVIQTVFKSYKKKKKKITMRPKTMEYHGEKGKESSGSQGKSKPKRKAQRKLKEKEKKEEREKMYKTIMEIHKSIG